MLAVRAACAQKIDDESVSERERRRRDRVAATGQRADFHPRARIKEAADPERSSAHLCRCINKRPTAGTRVENESSKANAADAAGLMMRFGNGKGTGRI